MRGSSLERYPERSGDLPGRLTLSDQNQGLRLTPSQARSPGAVLKLSHKLKRLPSGILGTILHPREPQRETSIAFRS